MEPMRAGAIAPEQSLPTSVPKKVGVMAVGAGAYTRILNVYGPSQAGSGETVHIQVVVKNLASYAIYIAVTGRYNGQEMFPFRPEYANVAAGGTYSFDNAFIMPNKDLTVDVWSWYWNGTEWIQDDHKAVSIKRVWVWIPLATASLLLKKAPIGAWIALATASLAVKKAPIGAWIALASATLPVSVAPVGAWVPLFSTSLAVKKALVGGWVPLRGDSLGVAVGIVPGKNIFKSLAVDFEKKMPKEFE